LITIDNFTIKQASEGRYCLNDLHKAAGGEQRHQPRYFLVNDSTKELIEAISGNPLVTKQGRYGGTFVCNELVYA
jgi:hypothetical protein